MGEKENTLFSKNYSHIGTNMTSWVMGQALTSCNGRQHNDTSVMQGTDEWN